MEFLIRLMGLFIILLGAGFYTLAIILGETPNFENTVVMGIMGLGVMLLPDKTEAK